MQKESTHKLARAIAAKLGQVEQDVRIEKAAEDYVVDGVVIALAAGDALWPGWTTLHGKPVVACIGGGERADSVLAALHALPDDVANDELLLVHDAARPNLGADDIPRWMWPAG